MVPNLENKAMQLLTDYIQPIIDTQFSFEEGQKALEHLEQGQYFGKVAIAF
jgi:NADPH:quinone reductase-like Zn-dependent oxidoreductase